MIEFYNAFISYKHAELDSKVASHVQRNLEHFHIPQAIRKKVGKKKIERIFRDKDELPITSDLTDTISNALEKADYLIVICSHNTCESIWVEREINFFLKNHSKSKILTVLADGEPTEVIPKILQQDERVIVDEDGTERTIKVNIEPLSCDYRMPLNKAKKLELPRLAAALIGCSYDELVRRQRAYKTRRLMLVSALIAAAAIAFGTYMYIAKQKVDDALRQSLISQSRYLASESQNLLDQERRIDGLYLALSSVPTDENDPRPVTSEGIAALTRATAAYRGMAGTNVDCVWNYNVGNTINDMAVSENGERLAAVNNLGAISVWNTQDHSKLFDIISPDMNILAIAFVDGDKLLVLGGSKLCAYDSTTGEMIWDYDARSLGNYTYAGMNSFNDDGIEVIEDGKVMVFVDGQSTALIIDTTNGHVLEEYDMSYEVDGYSLFYSHFHLSPDKSKIAFACFMGINENYIGVYDIRSGQLTVSDCIEEYVNDVMWYDDDHFLVSAFDLEGMESARFEDSYFIRPNYTDLFCYDPDGLELYWQAVHECNGLNLYRDFIGLYVDDLVAFYSGDTCTAYNINTGEVVYNWNANSSIVDVSDRDSDGRPLIITADGGMAFPVTGLGNDVISLSYEFATDLSNVIVNHGVYLYQQYGEEIIYYNTGVWDDEWTQIEGITASNIRSYYLDDEVFSVIYGSDDDIRMASIDPDRGELNWDVSADFDDAFYFNLEILGTYDGDIIVMNNSSGLFLYRVDEDNGSVDREVLTEELGASDFYFMNDHYICYLYSEYPSHRLGIYDLDTGDVESYPIDTDNVYTIDVPPQYYEELGFAYVPTQDGDSIVRIEDENVSRVDLPSDWNGTVCITADLQTGYYIVSDGKQIIFVDDRGDIEFSIYTSGRRPLGMEVLRQNEDDTGVLAVVYSEGQLARYDPYTGAFLGSSDISTYTDHICEAHITADWENGYLYIQMDRLEDVVNLDGWVEEAYIENCFGHHGPSDRFYTMSFEVESERGLGYYRHYSLQDLIDKAREILGDDFEIPAEIRSMYGL